MKTWKMNLLDKRSDSKSNTSDKFEFCKEKGIVGIGWVGVENKDLPEKDKELKAFNSAKSKLEQFEIGDYIWVKVPKETKLWLCKVKSGIIKTDDKKYNENDIGYYCECEYVREILPKALPKKVLYETLTTRSTISDTTEFVNESTNKIYQKITKKKKSSKEKIEWMLNSVKKYWYVYGVVLIAAIVAITVISVLNNSKADKVKNYLEGKTFIIEDRLYNDYVAYSFRDGKVSKEETRSHLRYLDEDGKIYGDINDFVKYKVRASIFSDEIVITENRYGNKYTQVITVYMQNGVVKNSINPDSTPEWTETTVKEINAARNDVICKHNLENVEVIREATCSHVGEKRGVCTKCKVLVTQETSTLPHNYSNGKCTVCGKEKPSESSSITSNTWYVYNDVLYFQNAEISYAAITSKNVVATYYAVCQHCQKKANVIGTAGVEINYPLEKIYHCPYCSGNTLVKFKIN